MSCWIASVEVTLAYSSKERTPSPVNGHYMCKDKKKHHKGIRKMLPILLDMLLNMLLINELKSYMDIDLVIKTK